nr:protein ALP1-like [Quercus suber]POE63977.1 protein alp1-like [Quercus suber]
MEITSFPFLNQEDFSLFFTSFQEMDNVNVNGNNNSNNNNNKKRQRKGEDFNYYYDDEETKKKSSGFTDILASIMLLDEEEKQEQELWFMEDQQDKALFDFNQNQKTQAMDDYHVQMQSHYSDVDQFDESRKAKRARRSAFAVTSTIATAAAAATTADNSASSSPPKPGSAATPHRRLWVKDRSKDWWDQFSSPDFPDEEFRRAFRMSKATFQMICDELDPVVMKKNTMLRDAIPVRTRVAVCIWRLATGEPLRLVSRRFGLGISTCHKLVLEVCSAIKGVLMSKFLHWPDENKVEIDKEEFRSISGIPNVGGSMYTTHVPIIAPKNNVASYFNKRHTERNQKTSYSITVQGIVDPKGVFTDVCIGYPGSMSDDQVLEKSALSQRGNMGLLKDVWIVGNSGYPLTDWVLVPYTHQNLTWCQHAFNEKIGEVQRVAKEAFARLKGRWSCLQKRTEVKLQDLPVVLGACCVLHNICEMRNEGLEPELSYEIFDDEMVAENGLRSANALQARDQIAHDLLHHGQAGTHYS